MPNRKLKEGNYGNRKRQAKPSELKVGNYVSIVFKCTTTFESTLYTVTEHKGIEIIAENQRHQVTRNASFFKKLKEVERESDDAEDIHGIIEPGEREQGEEVPEPILRRSTRLRMQTEYFGNPINSEIIFC